MKGLNMGVTEVRTKIQIKRACFLIGGVVLGVFILVPLFTAILLRLLFLLPKEKFASIFFADSTLQAIAFGASGFVMGLFISYGSINKETRSTVLGSLIIATFYIIQIGFTQFILGGSASDKAYGLFEMAVYTIFLLAFAILGAWLVARRRCLKVQKEV